MRFALALALVLALPVAGWSRPVTVTSGEHRDFTRIVLQFDAAVDWQVGRSLDGYALRLAGERGEYDLSKAFDLIGKTRLASLGADPVTGDLDIGIACACHAIPFEFRPGIVVIDLYDGPPPSGSSFEEPLPVLAESPPPPVETAKAEEAAPPPPAADGASLVEGYDWTRLSLAQMGLEPLAPVPGPGLEPEAPAALGPDIDSLRESLVQEMGMGATAGIIELAPPPKTADDPLAELAEEAVPQKPANEAAGSAEATLDTMMRAHLGETPQINLRDVGDRGPPLTAQGAKCLTDETLDIAAWGSDRPIAEQLGPIRNGMIEEFDKPSAEAIKRVVRFYLYIGFGAEARGLLRSYPDLLPEADVFTAMAHLLDSEPETQGVFTGMEDCDTAAALWAVLADPKALPREEIGRAAVARTFSSFPAALRRLLGPRLVDAYIEAGDIPTATALSEAVLRAPGDQGPEVVMMEAAMSRALGHAGEAEAKLEPLAAAPGPSSTDALVDLVEHRAMLGQRVSEEEVVTLEAALKERMGSEEEARYRKALVLAKAASGDFITGFAEAGDADTLSSIWRLLARSGGDTPLLTHATLAAGQPAPVEARESAGIIAERLLTLGLADQAARWLVLAPEVPNLLKARVALANGDAQGALDLIRDETSERALHLRAEALLAQGDQAGAARIYEELGKEDRQWSTLSAAQSWDVLSEDGPEAWKAVAAIIAEEPAAPADPATPIGTLEQDKLLVDQSASTRDAITNLLNSVQVPQPPSQ